MPSRGLFQFKRMPFGLTNAPATFQRLLDRLSGPEMEPHAFAYLDDVIIVTETFEEHLEWLSKVLKKIKEANLKINPTMEVGGRSDFSFRTNKSFFGSSSYFILS